MFFSEHKNILNIARKFCLDIYAFYTFLWKIFYFNSAYIRGEWFAHIFLNSFLTCLLAHRDEWLQVDLKTSTTVVAVATQGYSYSSYWTTSYKIAHGFTENDLQIIQNNEGQDLVSSFLWLLNDCFRELIATKTKWRKHICITKLTVSVYKMLREWNRSNPAFLKHALKLW